MQEKVVENLDAVRVQLVERCRVAQDAKLGCDADYIIVEVVCCLLDIRRLEKPRDGIGQLLLAVLDDGHAQAVVVMDERRCNNVSVL